MIAYQHAPPLLATPQLSPTPPSVPPVAAFAPGLSRTGYGLFTQRPWRAGDFLFTLYGQLLRGSWVNRPERQDQENAYQLGKDFYLMPTSLEGLLLNHSCHPNACLRRDVDIYARTDLNPGDEIRIDYSTCMGEPQWSMTCACGTPNCRGTIQCFHHLPLELQASYVAEGIVQQFLIEEFAGFPPGKRFP